MHKLQTNRQIFVIQINMEVACTQCLHIYCMLNKHAIFTYSVLAQTVTLHTFNEWRVKHIHVSVLHSHLH